MNKLQKKGYPSNWEQLSRECKRRDDYTCKHCGARQNEQRRGQKGWYRVILSAAHVDHKLIDHSLTNLISLCQKCHYTYDMIHYKKKKKEVVMINSWKSFSEQKK